MKRQLLTLVLVIVIGGVFACGQEPTNTQASVLEESSLNVADKTKQVESREGFYIQEISDELFERMDNVLEAESQEEYESMPRNEKKKDKSRIIRVCLILLLV